VTPYVTAQLAAGQTTIAFALVNVRSAGALSSFHSIEAANNQPQFLVGYLNPGFTLMGSGGNKAIADAEAARFISASAEPANATSAPYLPEGIPNRADDRRPGEPIDAGVYAGSVKPTYSITMAAAGEEQPTGQLEGLDVLAAWPF
jgi:hypothetical protein